MLTDAQVRAIRGLLSDETLDNTLMRSLESHLESFVKQPLPECFDYSYKRFAGSGFCAAAFLGRFAVHGFPCNVALANSNPEEDIWKEHAK